MFLVDPAEFSKELDRDASVLVFDKPLDDAEQFTLGYGYWQHTRWCIQWIARSQETQQLDDFYSTYQ